MAINYFTEQVAKPRLKYRLISKWLKSIIVQHTMKLGNISYIFCDDIYLLGINTRYLNHNYFTDIVSFDYVEGGKISGDIFISTDRVTENSVKYGVNLEEEFLRVISHGVLHLLKHKDQSEKEKKLMRKLESDYISMYKNLENDGSFEV
jgi:probable rRNA maturation factor